MTISNQLRTFAAIAAAYASCAAAGDGTWTQTASSDPRSNYRDTGSTSYFNWLDEANWQDGFCVPDDCPCRVINPRYSTIHDGCIDCDWFVKAVLPREPDLHTAYWHEIVREESDAGEGVEKLCSVP